MWIVAGGNYNDYEWMRVSHKGWGLSTIAMWKKMKSPTLIRRELLKNLIKEARLDPFRTLYLERSSISRLKWRQLSNQNSLTLFCWAPREVDLMLIKKNCGIFRRNVNEGSRKTRPKQNWKESAFRVRGPREDERDEERERCEKSRRRDNEKPTSLYFSI